MTEPVCNKKNEAVDNHYEDGLEILLVIILTAILILTLPLLRVNVYDTFASIEKSLNQVCRVMVDVVSQLFVFFNLDDALHQISQLL